MPITTSADRVGVYGGDSEHFLHVLDHLFRPALEAVGFTPIPPAAEGADLIQAEIVRNLEQADLVLCDISGLNPNVFFELGIRTSLDRPICLVRDEHTAHIPFDTNMINCHSYRAGLHPWQLEREIERLSEHITSSVGRSDGRNALWRYFGLTQRGIDAINAAPDDPQASALGVVLDEVKSLRQEVERNRARPEMDPFETAREDAIERYGFPVGAFIDAARTIAALNNARLVVRAASSDGVVLDAGGFILDQQQRDLITEAAAFRGVSVEILGGLEVDEDPLV